MNSLPRRRQRSWSRAALAGCLLLQSAIAIRAAIAFPHAPQAPEIVAFRDEPSSISAEYGPAVPLGSGIGDGLFVVPTGAGIEIRDTALGAGDILGMFRTAGRVDRVAVLGSTAYLFAGDRGIVAVDLSDPSSPEALASYSGLGQVTNGAVSPGGYGLVATDGVSTLHFFAAGAAGAVTPLRTVTFGDGRRINAIVARSDSFLVASTLPADLPDSVREVTARSAIVPGLILTLYRLSSGAGAPESLTEFEFDDHEALDVAWRGPLAFVADGNLGVLVVDVPTATIVRSVPVQGSQFAFSVDANDTSVVAVALGRVLARYLRTGVDGNELTPIGVDPLDLEPRHVRLRGEMAIVSTHDQLGAIEPDEIVRSALEFARVSGGAAPEPTGGTGRTRRVVVSDGLAYVADYSGGLRIYRVAGSDTSLVGVLPGAPSELVVDLALDPVRQLVYLAAGAGALQIVSVADPSAPVAIAAVPVPGLASAVALAGPTLVAVGWRTGTPGIKFVDVTIPDGPFDRGSVFAPFVLDPREMVARDTVLFVADAELGLAAIRFGNPNAPAALGAATGFGARDLDLTGNTLLVGTRFRGLQVVDVVSPISPILRSELPAPPIFGLARSGTSAALFLGAGGVLVVDVQDPSAPFVRGPIAVPGHARGGAWVGDTLVVAAALALERFTASAATAVPTLDLRLETQRTVPIVRISWDPVLLTGVVGLNVYSDLDPDSGAASPYGRRVNRALLPPGAVETFDDLLLAGAEHRYRLEAFFLDGGSRKVAEGSIFVPTALRLGRPYPNPYRSTGGTVNLPFQTLPGAEGRILTLRVYAVSGRLVRTIRTSVGAAGGFGGIGWDGRDEAGRRVPGGMYFLHVEGAGIDGARSTTILR
ncbi:MAG TPA: FlgD immunoglobulin-like domain containing protein [Candidatus Eisenbacteria bacterium]|nr:FlgD immunoglobulin-like domain containing protein [Candidatus Eisenbacteria bacterium]